MSRRAETIDLLHGMGSVRKLQPGEFEQIRELAYRSFGLDLKPGKEELVEARLRKLARAAGTQTFQDYYRHVVADRSGASLGAMIDALTTNHTSFLREPEHFDYLQKNVLPRLAGRSTVEVWSAACSTGEEVWTLAFLLNEAFPEGCVHILASDISTKVLRLAAEARFSADRCAGLPASWLSRYFQLEKGPAPTYRVHPKQRQQVDFKRINLVEPFPFQKRFPVIFCRNVMIYFDRETQTRVIGQLSGCLEPGGYLFVGHAESLIRISHDLEYIGPAIYRKPGGLAEGRVGDKERRWTRS